MRNADVTLDAPLLVDGNQEFAEAKVGPLHLLLGMLMLSPTFFDGYDTFNPAYVINT